MARTYGKAQDLIDFTRASSGTALRRVKYGDELVTNGTFDTDSDWVLSGDATISGGKATLSAQYAVIQQNISITNGQLVRISYQVVSNTDEANPNLALSSSGFTNSTTFINNDVGNHTIDVVVEDATKPLRFVLALATTIVIDNVSVKEVTFDTSDGDLVLFNHPNNIPRIEYDANGNVLGLLVEEARTNLITYSEDFSQWAEYGYGGASLSIDYGYVSPDGSNNASKLTYTEGSGSNGYLLTNNVSATASVDHSLSIWMKGEVGGEKVRVDFKNNSSSGIAGDVFTLTTEWVKYSVTVTNDTGTVRGFQIRLTSADFVSSQVFYIYGAQVEQGSFPTSYIPTSGSTATRSADVASIGVSEFGYNQKSGTMVVTGSRPYSMTSSEAYFSISDGTANNRFTLYIQSNSNYLNGYVAPTPLVLTDNVSADIGGIDTWALSYEIGHFTFAQNGFIGSDTDSGSGTFAGKTIAYFGNAYTGATEIPNGHIKSIKYYPRRLTNAQLQELTS